jgi:hypothetical protein
MVSIIYCSSVSWYKRDVIERTGIPPTRFELVSPDPKSCMIDRYTTGVDTVLVEYTSQISLQKICSIPFDAEDIKINIRSKEIRLHTKAGLHNMYKGAEGARSVRSEVAILPHRFTGYEAARS